ncbi:hypothetical protein ACIQV3_18060 [Streptomyces sp. NPDC099050]|uniref:hypothetical protein n=1 Tax=Streptomyces sp. NPDC099050 TaxID=3366100 RepID=UPI0037F2467B
MSENEVTPEPTDLGSIPSQVQAQESPTVAVARERLVEAIGREAVFLADQRAGQASQGLEALARAFALVASPASAAAATAVTATPVSTSRLLPVNQDTIAQRETVQLTGR